MMRSCLEACVAAFGMRSSLPNVRDAVAIISESPAPNLAKVGKTILKRTISLLRNSSRQALPTKRRSKRASKSLHEPTHILLAFFGSLVLPDHALWTLVQTSRLPGGTPFSIWFLARNLLSTWGEKWSYGTVVRSLWMAQTLPARLLFPLLEFSLWKVTTCLVGLSPLLGCTICAAFPYHWTL
jgi:hypothetical protein